MEEGPSFGVLVAKEANTQGKVRSNESFSRKPLFSWCSKMHEVIFYPQSLPSMVLTQHMVVALEIPVE